jgi:hypothetical protein
VAGLFGLVHGLGFAGALRELGLSRSSGVVPLLGFNVGVELGQLAAVCAALALARALRAPLGRRPWLRAATCYTLGGTAAYWLSDRVLAIVAATA